MQFNSFLETKLNPQQRQGVLIKDGPLLVVAGAGSGKTRVITARIANLIINENVHPSEIIALTFTNKAAKEMQERIATFLDKDSELPFIGTFHSYGVRLLKKNQHLLSTPFFGILDTDDKKKLIQDIITRNGLNKQVSAKNIAHAISSIKNQSGEPGAQISLLHENQLLQDIYTCYEKEKKISRCLDFDDLLLETLNLFVKNPGFKAQFQQQVRHVLVDEYQDTNVVQHNLLKQMTLDDAGTFKAASLCVVGDEDQSIYSWRGATVANIINFKKDFPATQTIKIEQNYRSVQHILSVANTVIEHNTIRNPKTLRSDLPGKDRVRVFTCSSEYQEGELIAQFAHLTRTANKKSSCALLYRAHYQSRALEEALIKNNIPYQIIGGIAFYDRKEIKDILAYIRLIINPFDRASFLRVINTPTRGLGKKFEELFYDRWATQPFLSFTDLAKQLCEDGSLTRTRKAALIDFLRIFDGITPENTPATAVERIVITSGYIPYLKNSCDLQEAESRIENIKELSHALLHLEKEGVNTIEQFLEHVALMNEKVNNKDAQQENPVLLMTLHAAKGLEFDSVVIAGLEEGVLPSSRSLIEVETIEEERRLLYVGITRARKRLLLSHAQNRYTYGRMSEQLSSRFLQEIPSRTVQQHDCTAEDPRSIRQMLSQWLGVQHTPASPVFTFGSAQRTPSRPSFKKRTSRNSPERKTGSGRWKKQQPVKHKTFGIGVIQNTEKRGQQTIVTVKFKSGIKKIAAQFLSTL